MARTARPTPGPSGSQPRRQPQPLPVRTRTVGDFVKAFFAFIALSALLIGVPGALAYFVGWPLPDEAPTLETVRQPITASVFIDVLTVVVWLAWAQFAACVLVEGKAEISGVGMPSRVPGAGPSQLLARQLVAALLLVGASAASLTPGLAQIGNAYDDNARSTVASAHQTPGQTGDQADAPGGQRQLEAHERRMVDPAHPGAGTARAGDEHRQTKFYRIQPPEGRHHDSLWEIAERHLDDGRRYKEIYQLNTDRVQPDGSKLSQASLIRPGWIMEMPADAHGGELVEMPEDSPEITKDLREQIHEYDKSRRTPAPDTDPAHTGPGHADPAHDVTVDRPLPPLPADQTPATAAAPADDSGFGLSEALIGAPLLAAGLLAALGRRRRAALWQSAMSALGLGSGIDLTATGPAARIEEALLVGADPAAVRDLDSALRGLSAALAAEGRSLPVVYAAWLTGTELHLQLAATAGEPPQPWQLGQDATFWRLRRSAIVAHADDGTAAPYPGLVSLGTLDDDARLLLNLEAVPGIVSLTGAAADRTAVFASVAAELATSGWSDRLTLTLVGFGAELGALAPTRIRHLDGVAALVETMTAETEQRRAALSAAGHDSVLTGRTGQAQHTQRAPHLVLLATEPTEAQAARLAELAADSGRLGIGYLIGTSQQQFPGASWELEITGEGRLRAPLLGLELTAQQLPEEQHRAVVDLFAAADPDGGDDGGGAGPAAAHRAPFLVDISETGRPAVYARLLGNYEIIGLESPDDQRGALLHEALALLLLHREGVHPRVLASALWPRGATEDVRDALIERLGTWLGSDGQPGAQQGVQPAGQPGAQPGSAAASAPRLRTDATGRLTLATSVVSDLDVLRTLHHEAIQGRGANSARVRERLLTDALALARGPLLAGRPQGRYGWLSHEIIDAQLPLLVADVALALAAHHREADQPRKAMEALETALNSAPADERLWNELLRAAHATTDTTLLTTTATALLDRNATLSNGTRGLPPRTEALLDELLPTWRDDTGAAAN
ncbi:bacterial transcriptional activator domain-containing protein [Streptomyces sp. HSW2009]|uniref:bacterial transcriptional activator domain-containing protein n=1 Tax=Streptomyces sp. HSW2009 TaxID=3142890 RepID=UPI0032EC8BF1